MSDLDTLLRKVARTHRVDRWTRLDPAALVCTPDVRELCAADKCGHFGRHHQCPPTVGPLERCAARLHAFTRGVLFQTSYRVNVQDREALRATQRLFHEAVLVLETALHRPGESTAWGLIGGPCVLCEPCAATTDAPCPRAAEARPSLEALGIDVVGLQAANGWDAEFYADRVTWTGAVLFERPPSERSAPRDHDPELPILRARPALTRALARWYRQDHRDLPWRQTRDPYVLWVSEIMLQQTQVETVIPYFRRFLARFPDVHALARAPLDAVLKQWEGLGYYARARHLHQAARRIANEQDGCFPRTFGALLRLPGVGRTTAGSILCFAFDEPHPALDGNVKRVLLRLYNVALLKSLPAVDRWLWRAATTLLPGRETVASHNQAVIELGATVCTPTSPHCDRCPIRRWCRARQAGTQHDLPVSPGRKQTPHYTIGVGVIHRRNKVLVQRRPPTGLLGGLWEFPGGKRAGGEALRQTVKREIAEELGIEVSVQEKIAVIKHAYSHFRITLHAYHCTYLGGTVRPRAADAWKWVPLQQLAKLAFPRANGRIIEQLLR